MTAQSVTMMCSSRCILYCILVLACLTYFSQCVTHYQFKHYTYRKKRDDKRYKAARQRCEMEAECQGSLGVQHTKCLRKCMSPFCYKELYEHDELEEGEIDVRLNSYKGCLSQVKIEDF